MRVAIYVRVSTEEQIHSAEAQTVGAEAWAKKRGDDVVQIYRDDDVSGAEWTRRPAVLQLLADAKTTPRPWDVLVMRDLDRLGRDALRLGLAVETLHDHGVRMFEWAIDKEIEGDPMARALLVMRGVVGEMERGAIAHRTRTALKGKAERGLVVGGRCYGYDNVRSADGVRYQVNEAEAAIIREIYERASRGESARLIARALNDRGLPPPRAGYQGMGIWSPNEVYVILRNDRYRGVVRWGVLGSRYRGGTRVTVKAPAEAVVERHDPALAIVTDDLWQRVQEESTNGRAGLGLAPKHGTPTRYFLVGLARCGTCGGPIGSGRTRAGNKVVNAYLCLWHRDRGNAVCAAGYCRAQFRLDAIVMDWLSKEVLDPELVTQAAQLARERARGGQPDLVVAALETELREVTAQLARVTQAIALTTDDVPELAKMASDRSKRAAEIRVQLAKRGTPTSVIPLDREAKLRAAVADLRGTLERHPQRAREVLAAVLVGRVWVTLTEPRGPLELYAEAAPGALLSAMENQGTRGMSATPAGLEPALPT